MLLSRFLLPEKGLKNSLDLYFKVLSSDNAFILHDKIVMRRFSHVSFDTFYNSFPVKPWRSNVNLANLVLKLKGKGDFLIKIAIGKRSNGVTYINEKIISLTETESEIKINNIIKFNDGVLFFEMIALEDDCYFSGGGFSSDMTPLNDVKLGIVITHFNRKQQVLPAIKRIEEELLENEFYKGKVELVVVDNSENITADEAGNITLIPNENLGGSGGFSRGLLYLKESKQMTHCLFMDDDASCEIESIKRTFNFLSLSHTDKQAVSGGLLRELEPTRLMEKGAVFNGMAKPLCHELDMAKLEDLVIASDCNVKPNYGAWWFFAFKISDVQRYVFPFFVRGDDIQFSILNKFNIETFNGVACFGDDFSLKSSPMTRYLDVRHTLVQNLIIENRSLKVSIKNSMKFFFAALFSYNYDSARCTSYAMRDFMKGPGFWVENMDMSDLRKEFSSKFLGEKMASVSDDMTSENNLKNYFNTKPDVYESKVRLAIRIFTLQGFLLPSFFIKNKTVVQEKSTSVDLRATFRAKTILHYYKPYQIGYIAEHNKTKFFSEIFYFFYNILKLIFVNKKLRKEYNEKISDLTSLEFWERIYKK